MQTLHVARRVSVEAACFALSELITARLLDDLPNDEDTESSLPIYIEKACVTYVYFASNDPNSISSSLIDQLQHTLELIIRRTGRTLSPKATHAAQTLIWKATGEANADSADRWCELLRNPLFDSAGQINKARIGRGDIASSAV